ncbi:MAG: ArsC/Spx/MgsR family protein [Niameybacter sp.]
MNLKDQVSTLSLEEAVELLTSNGMLIKRPILVTEDTVLVGFKQEAYDEALRK